MDNNRGSYSTGIMLILMGGLFLLSRFVPGFHVGDWWPLFILGVGLFFLVSGFIGNPRMLVPGSVVTFAGSVLLYKNMTHSWSYWELWLLTPAAVGLGLFLSEYKMRKDFASALAGSWFMMALGVLIFILFQLPFGWDKLWPFVLIIVGVGILLKNRTSGSDKQ